MMALLLVLLCGCLFASSYALECSLPVSPVTYIAFPTPYNNVLVLHPGLTGCTLFRDTHFQCGYSRVLGDGDTAPSIPDLTNAAYVRSFLAWQRGPTVAYVDFDLTGVTTDVTAIQLSFLNSPNMRISLPNVQLYTVQYGASLATDTLTPITSWVLHNQLLSQPDNQVRTVSMQLITGLSAIHLRIKIQFTEFHDFDWFMLSEVTFCTDPLPLFEPSITFQSPSTIIIQPSAEDLRRGSIELVCTVSSQGTYTWQWEKDSSTIIDGAIIIGDGTRTTTLTLSNLNFNSTGVYSCVAMTTDTMGTQIFNTSVQEIQFPEVVRSPPSISGQDIVMLVCHLHGYQTSLFPPVWFNSGDQLMQSPKHTLNVSQGYRDIVLENGTILPSLMVTLTIHNLSTADEGNYTCRGLREESVTQLTVLPPPTTQPPTTQPPTTQPPTTQPPTTQPPTTQPPTTDSTFSGSEDSTMVTVTTTPPSTTNMVPVYVAVGVVGGLALLCVLMALPALIVYQVQKIRYSREMRDFQHSSQISPKLPHRHQHDLLSPDKSVDMENPDTPVVMENPVYRYRTDHAFEQSEVFSYYRDM